ncbi:hypothetical protein K431DRAFT_350272 [Polychaeton citri CBS 116435]|uniref:Uncharacterized protein n=1 Tax=Polychaeton citri CBS 116435 TaxID=1314669 RepID=A0A9P4UKQ3_9PEZI|nr:hypothetical protein K431DRAFT_350272 [Polychaeton citri CBS 116435]
MTKWDSYSSPRDYQVYIAEPKEQTLQVDLSTVFTLFRDFGTYELARRPHDGHRGSIMNIASLVSSQGWITPHTYTTAKGGAA